jgi:hypothetical protein
MAEKDGQNYRMVSDAEKFLEQVFTLFGVLPKEVIPILAVLGTVVMLRYERKNLGLIGVRISFFLRTFCESVYFGLFIGHASALIAALVIFVFFGIFPPTISPSTPGNLVSVLQRTGFGFYEELLYRVILLGGLLSVFKMLRILGIVARVIAVTIISVIFASVHFIGPFAYPYDTGTFLYLSYLGVLFSAIYLWRGFATVAWSHALFDIFLSF